ncbi:RagB/SusD family nutrient uptake outer membrane protein [Flavivirga abyssicola]|uniref:RagB/SusD family nutrient uptake outer membrane protein n=1 Tax=Flavivirga abyssicola TaxID=3063533 RepID=UPI0026DFE462|nr:RagB/SusD family nutrient uptake outer membrane protein [Flavivirga sp. MEBiC07777]WVK12588.1 RagB/SusD family nutrient uptake outer membrane protein [Flavivirga sp. MEBiC07777]
MKKLFKTNFILTTIVIFLGVTSCSEDFLDRPPEDSFNVADFFDTQAQVETSTNALYSIPWFDFSSNTMWVIGELSSGNGRTWDPRNADFTNFAVNGNNAQIGRTWESLFAVVGQSNYIINTLPEAVNPNIPQEVVNNAIGEARFMRATAYFYLVRIFGSVPIIERNTDFVLEPVVSRNLVSDVYRFIREDFEFAADNCYSKIRGANFDANARISSGSAKAMLAKVYLYEENYQMAYQLSDEVINSGEFKLLGGDDTDGIASSSYYDLFLPENDNNQESIFALQWTSSSRFAEGNGVQSLFAPSAFTGGADGYSAIGPSPDLLAAYEDTDRDVRFYATIFERGATYPDINGGYTVPDNIDFQGTRHGLKKYVVGSDDATARDDGSGNTTTSNNTYILRYGELLLIHAEAALNGGGPAARGIESFNKIRRRAGLDEIVAPTLDDVFQERRIELAFEFEFWYDIVRRGPGFAINFLSNTDRGTFNSDTGVLQPEFFQASTDDLLFPYPTVETQNNPALLEAPVPYDFN